MSEERLTDLPPEEEAKLREQYTFVSDQSEHKDSPCGDVGSTIMIVNSEGIFKISSDTNVSHFKKYYAIGSGSDYALGALYPSVENDDDPARLATTAVETAINFDAYCGGQIELYETKP